MYRYWRPNMTAGQTPAFGYTFDSAEGTTLWAVQVGVGTVIAVAICERR